MSEDEVQEGNVLPATKHLRPVSGPREELESLFRDHNELVFRAAYRVTGSVADAEDVLQTVFLRLAGRKGLIDLSPNPKSYLQRAAVNASLDILRGQSRRRPVPLEDSDAYAMRHPGKNPDRELVDSELCNYVRKSVSTLGPKAAEMVALKYFEGYDNREIAEVAGTSQMVVAVILHRARTRLRKEIRRYLEGHHEAK